MDRHNWSGFIQDVYGLIGYYEINAVLSGTDAVEEEFERLIDLSQKDDKMTFLTLSKG